VTFNEMEKSLLIPETPTTYTLELTSRCNSVCLGCGNTDVLDRSIGEMDFTRWQTLLTQIQPEIVSLRVTGGEPTLHPQFAEIIELIDSLGVPFVLFSNGLWSHPKEIIALLQHCNHLDGILISLHGADRQSHQAFAGINSFDRVTHAIQQATRAGLNVNTNSVLTRANQYQIAKIASLSKELGASFAAFSRYYGPTTQITNLEESELQAVTNEIYELKQQGFQVQFNNCIPSCFNGQPTKSCPAGITHCTIDPLGQVRPCTHAPHILGNLFEQSIAEIWQSEPAQEWRTLIPAECIDCAEYLRCRGGCKAMAYHQHQMKDPLSRQPLADTISSNTQHKLQLPSKALPVVNFTLREENFGMLLINRNQIIPMKEDARPILNAINGENTLRDIENEFGEAGVWLIAYLFTKGLVLLRQDQKI
jgi:radical SAM protein with 4Fe4S-binding SPASM domain